MNSTYVVKERDTLTKIAGMHGVTVPELVAANGIKNPQFIRKDQVLIIPPRKHAALSPSPRSLDATEKPTKNLYIQAKCAAGKPIPNLKLAIEVGCDRTEHITDSSGQIPALAVVDADQNVKIFAEKSSGGWKKISELSVSHENTSVSLQSPKVSVDSKTAVHDGPAQTSKLDKPVPTAPGTTEERRSANGNPVQSVALECPNKENLKLLANFKYRDIILAASKRSNICPQAIAAIMNAEAATIIITEQVPVINKKSKKQEVGRDGKPKFKTKKTSTGEWDPNSASPNSSARGMTQFLDGSWIDQATIKGTFLNDYATSQGWMTETTITVKQGKKSIDKKVAAFKLANGGFVTARKGYSLAQTLNSDTYLNGRATAKDANLQKLLDLRFKADFAIHTAVDYGTQNLKGLEERGIHTSSLPDSEKAKIIYLTHHLGLGDAIEFIRRSMGPKKARHLYEQQVGVTAAEEEADEFGGDYVAAHRAWLQGFIDNKIKITEKMCDASSMAQPRTLIAITDSIA